MKLSAVREYLNERPWVSVGLVLLTVGLCIAWVVHTSRGNRPNYGPTQKYVDAETFQPVQYPTRQVSPVTTKEGRTLVTAIYLTCADCGGGPKIAYLFKYTPEAKQKLDTVLASDDMTGRADAFMAAQGGKLVSAPEKDAEWVPFASEKGQEITSMRCRVDASHQVRPVP